MNSPDRHLQRVFRFLPADLTAGWILKTLGSDVKSWLLNVDTEFANYKQTFF